MSLFHMDLTNLSYQDIEAFCSLDLPEGVRLDYKRELSTKSPEAQVAKGVSAFANTQGGILLFGVGTKSSSRHPNWPTDGMTSDPSFEQRITRWCIEHIDPPLTPQIGYVENPNVPGRAFAVIRTELSWLTPHTTEHGERIYVRRADNSDPVPARFDEIELLRNQRERARVLEEAHESDLRHRLGLRVVPKTRSMFLLVRPEFSSEMAIALSDLPAFVDELGASGFEVDRIRSYSQGVTSTEVPGRSLYATSRAHFGYGVDHGLAGGKRDKEITLENLMSWSLLAATAALRLSERAHYWGRLIISFEAYELRGIAISQTNLSCVDPQIKIRVHWSADVLRENPCKEAARLFWRIMWSIGMQGQTWSHEDSEARLRRHAASKKFQV